MKRLVLVSVLLLGFVGVISLVAAFNFGEESQPYVSGKVTIDASLDDKAQFSKTLFLIVFGDQIPMPYGAMKIRLKEPLSSDNPVEFRLTKERLQLMNESRPLPRILRVKARLDRDGIAGPDQPGDIVGFLDDVPVGAYDQEILIAVYKEQS
ncbi:MAG: hypothetical protein HRU19_17895 [Pseudobacteriovorax sp.]|nr:hypothetical protein [Pseudobacteriovorax sp.]